MPSTGSSCATGATPRSTACRPSRCKPARPLRQHHRASHRQRLARRQIADELRRRACCAERDDGDVEQFYSQLSDGRCIAVTVQPMPDGGTVTTHQDITEQRRSEAKIAHMALHDALTGLPNRVLLNERLEHALTRVKRGEMVACTSARSRPLQERQRHAGPSRRRQAAEDGGRAPARRWCARPTRSRAWAATSSPSCRWPSRSPPTPPRSRMRIIEAVSAPYDIDGHQVVIGTSVGIAIGPTDGISPDELMRNADLALYRAKGDGRGTFRFFEPDMDAQMQARRAMERDLRKALAGRRVRAALPARRQPRDATRSAGFEALMRWRHPDEGHGPARRPSSRWPRRSASSSRSANGSSGRPAPRPRPGPSRSRSPSISRPRSSARPGLVQVVVGALAASGLPARPARARDHREHPAAGQRERRSPRSTSCARSACASPWTTSAPATPRSATCRASRSTRSRSTARSSRTSPTASARSTSCAPSRPWPRASA